jgi:hypothetical protein
MPLIKLSTNAGVPPFMPVLYTICTCNPKTIGDWPAKNLLEFLRHLTDGDLSDVKTQVSFLQANRQLFLDYTYKLYRALA